ncbi:MAG: helix-turn-helix domain-containing protein [Pseudomonadota bacterium]
MAKSEENIEWRSVCPICSGLDVLGDKWTMLIIRDLIIHGPRTYSELLESPEHISTNILADRLELLVSLRLIKRVHPEKSARNNAFKLTESGAALRPVLEGLAVWASTHLKEFHNKIVSTAPKKNKK